MKIVTILFALLSFSAFAKCPEVTPIVLGGNHPEHVKLTYSCSDRDIELCLFRSKVGWYTRDAFQVRMSGVTISNFDYLEYNTKYSDSIGVVNASYEPSDFRSTKTAYYVDLYKRTMTADLTFGVKKSNVRRTHRLNCKKAN